MQRPVNRRLILGIQFALLLFWAILFLALYLFGSAVPEAVLTKTASLSVVIQLTWMAASWRLLSGSLVNLYGLFILMVAVTHSAVPLLDLFGIPQRGSAVYLTWIASIPPWAKFEGRFFTTVSCSLLHLAACYVRPSNRLFGVRTDKRTAMRITGYILLTGGLIALFYYGQVVLPARDMLGYVAYFRTHEVSSWALNGTLFAPVGALFLFASSRHFDVRRLVSLVAIGIYSVVFLYVGSRNRAFLVLIALVVANQTIGRRLPGSLLLAGAVGILLIAPLISLIRLVPDLSWQQAYASLGSVEELIATALSELGVYSDIVATTVATFPEKMSFNFGLSYLNAVFYVIPNLFLPRGERLGFDASTVTWLANTYFVEYVERDEGFGTGYSFVAEAYQSFGWLGVLVMPIFGYLIAFISNSTRSGNPLAIAFATAVLPWVLFFARDSFYSLARGLIWYGLLPVLLVVAINSVLRIGHRRYAIPSA